MKNSKGITLIALIITIIVLLILAVVAIGAVQNDGIINYAKNARDQYGLAQDKENETLQNHLLILNQYTNDLHKSGECATCNDSGKIEGYVCSECSKISAKSATEVTYDYRCPTNMMMCGGHYYGVKQQMTNCPSCTSELEFEGANYKLSCGHNYESENILEPTMNDCPDC